METQEKPFTLIEASNYLNLSKSYLYKLTHKKLIPHYKPLGKKVYFIKGELDSFLRSKPILTEKEIDQKSTDYLAQSEGGR